MPVNDWPALSARERQLLKLASHGYTDSAIAHRLGIRESTVSTYWKRIRTKIGPHSRTELVALVMKSQLEKTLAAIQEQSARQSASEGFYRRLLDEAPDAILILTANGMIEMLNESAAALFGWENDELVGRHISVLVPERFRTHHAEHVAGYVQAPTKRPMRNHIATPGLHRSGSEIPVDASLSATGTGGSLRVICMVRSMGSRLFGDGAVDLP